MKDTTATVARLVDERYRAMTPEERLRVAAGMYETARAIIESSLPAELTGAERRLAVARRFYSEDVSEAVLRAWAYHAA